MFTGYLNWMNTYLKSTHMSVDNLMFYKSEGLPWLEKWYVVYYRVDVVTTDSSL